jgi:hypothetical protein
MSVNGRIHGKSIGKDSRKAIDLRAGRVTQVVLCLPSKHEALSLSSSITKEEEKGLN